MSENVLEFLTDLRHVAALRDISHPRPFQEVLERGGHVRLVQHRSIALATHVLDVVFHGIQGQWRFQEEHFRNSHGPGIHVRLEVVPVVEENFHPHVDLCARPGHEKDLFSLW